jgi:hypothetical protein
MMEGYFNSSKNYRPGAKGSGHVLQLVGQSGRRDCRPEVTATVSGVRRPSTIGFGRDSRLVDVRFCPQAPNKDRARREAVAHAPTHQHQFAAIHRVADHRRGIVRKDTGHRWQIADIATRKMWTAPRLSGL